MKTTYLVSAIALVGASLAIGNGCKVSVSDIDDGGAGGTGGSQGPTGPSGPGATTATGTGGSGAGTTTDGNDSFAEAKEMTVGTQVDGQINPKNDYDYYKFTGTAGQAVTILTDAKPNDNPYADGYADLVITLYDENEVRIAENDDPIPRTTQDSKLTTVLPSAGTYYIRVGDFCYWEEQETGTNPCGTSYAITNPPSAPGAYALNVVDIDFAEDYNFNETEGDTVTYASTSESTSGYFGTTIKGTFEDTTAVDSFQWKIPADWDLSNWPTASYRETAYFETYPAGDKGNGSTTALGDVWVTTSSDPNTGIIAKIDATNIDPTFGMELNFPVTFDTDYWIHVKPAASTTAVGSNPFYFLYHAASGSNPLEAEAADSGANNTAATAETLTIDTSSTGNSVYWIAGDIDSSASNSADDVDYYKFSLSGISPTLKMGCTCSGARRGAGLEGLTLKILKGTDAAGTPVVTSSETAMDSANCGDMGSDIPTGETELYLEVSASGQSASVSGKYYSCGVVFYEPSN